jgi:hypothetical protein
VVDAAYSSRVHDGAARLLFFWDYDTQWGADRSRTPGGKKDWGHLEFANTEILLELLARYSVPSCFAVVGSAALPGSHPYHDPAQIRRIHEAGHEVGSHSHRHEWLPGLNNSQLRETLRSSKDALEQCIGAPVSTFVPPWNQPFDYAAGLSFSLSERRGAGRDRVNVGRLCNALRETGYRFCRVAYRPIYQRLADRIVRPRFFQLGRTESIGGITCVRVNTPSGFGGLTRGSVMRCVERGALVVVWGHPHSLTLGKAQDQTWLLPFLEMIADLRDAGRLSIILPRDLDGCPSQ